MLKMKVLLHYISSLMYFIKCNNPVWKILFFEISGTILSFEWKNPEQINYITFWIFLLSFLLNFLIFATLKSGNFKIFLSFYLSFTFLFARNSCTYGNILLQANSNKEKSPHTRLLWKITWYYGLQHSFRYYRINWTY